MSSRVGTTETNADGAPECLIVVGWAQVSLQEAIRAGPAADLGGWRPALAVFYSAGMQPLVAGNPSERFFFQLATEGDGKIKK